MSRSQVAAALRQALMTTAAAWISFETTAWVGSAEAYWAAISAIVVMQSDLIGTRNSARDRLVGTAIGAVTGWACATVWQEHTSIYALAIGGCVLLCGLLNLGAAGRLSAVTLTVIVLIPRDEPIWRIALFRFLQVSWGIAVAVGVAELVARAERRWLAPAASPAAPAPPMPAATAPLDAPARPLPAPTAPLEAPARPLPVPTAPLDAPARPLPVATAPLEAPAPAAPASARPVGDAGNPAAALRRQP
jgi:hypothetical protein